MINLLISGMCGATSLTTVLHILMEKKSEYKGRWYLFGIVLTNMILSAAYSAEYLVTGHQGLWKHYLLWVCAFVEFLVPSLMIVLLKAYLYDQIRRSGAIVGGLFPHTLWNLSLLILGALFSVMGRNYTIDSGNTYHRGDFFLYTQMISLVLVAGILIILIRYAYCLESGFRIVILLYILFPLAAVKIQNLYPDIYVTEIGLTLSILVMAIYYGYRQQRVLAESREQLENAQVLLFLSQMKPHFLYNALSSISQLCKQEPVKASEMADRFAEYLRKNMADIQNEELISFDQELRHLKNYIAIEQMRFGEDDVRVAYDLQCTDFKMPSFVMQPLVENAIKHGLLQREDGGMIRIATREEKDTVILTISDNGVGFDTECMYRDGQPHMGLASAGDRLKRSVNGRIQISSIPGKGTTVNIYIPREAADR